MVEGMAPTRRRRLGAHGMMFRRRRIFAQLREGFTYDEIAVEEGDFTDEANGPEATLREARRG
jgi:hypothetical protein